jgi:hypothetical protein
MKLLASIVLSAAALGFAASARADDPSLHEVYQAVHDGRLNDAQSMMTTVLRDHPQSARAHYVEAEVLVRMARADEARAELARAEELAPGLPFAKPEAVQDLRGLIAERGRSLRIAEPRSADAGFPWMPVLLIGGAGLLLFVVLRNRRATMVPTVGGAMTPAGAPYGAAPYGAPYGAPMGGPGIGSGIVGGLATGAAVGAGMVAGEALAHEFIGNHERDGLRADNGSLEPTRVAYDDGGRDFGISDSGSWDGGGDIAGGGGGGGDWG